MRVHRLITEHKPPAGARPISWQRNLYALTLASFFMFVAFGFVFPFLPLFIQYDLNIPDVHQVEVWSGVTAFGQAVLLSLFSPIWGALADRHGRRLMVLRVAFSGALVIGLMGLTVNIWQFFALRVIQGALTGVVAASTALASSFVPRERLGFSLGLLQMALFAGNAVGPLVGGAVADHVGYRASFAVAAALFIAAGVTTLFLVQEHFVPPSGGGSKGLRGLLEDIRTRGRERQLIVMMMVVFSIQYGANVVLPILPLFVQQLDASQPAATLTGVIYTVAGVVAAVSSVVLGRLGDQTGHRRLLILLALGAGVFYIPQAFAGTVLQLILLRGLMGFFDGGLLPSANAIISAGTEGQARGSHGTTYGLIYLATGMGFGLGPLSGGFIAATLGIRSVFLITAFILLALGLYLPFGIRTDPTRGGPPATVPAEVVSQ